MIHSGQGRKVLTDEVTFRVGKRENEVICIPSRENKVNSTLLGTCLMCPGRNDTRVDRSGWW